MSAVGASERIFQLLDRQPAIHTKGCATVRDVGVLELQS